MYTRLGLKELEEKLASREDGLACLCSEFNCECHELVGKLLADLVLLHERLVQVKEAIPDGI